MELVRAFAPQTELLTPFAAFFAAFLLLLTLAPKARKFALCLLLGAVCGCASVYSTDTRLEAVRVKYAGRTVKVTAQVRSVSDGYYAGVVDAVLQVENINGDEVDFLAECVSLPSCEAGEIITGKFILNKPEQDACMDAYADGIALMAEYRKDFAVLGQSSSFRACTARLQKRLSASLCSKMGEDTGAVLTAMTVGDRSLISGTLSGAYRAAGLSHVLVVSGMHVSILCGSMFTGLLPYSRRERSYRRRRTGAVCRALLALLLAGVTGFTPSVIRAAVAVWISALGVWIYGAPDALTSLAAAGILMTAGNCYAACDVGFELSFAAVVGTLAGAECARRSRSFCDKVLTSKAPHNKKAAPARKIEKTLWGLWESLCIAACASAATFPVLVLRGMCVSLYGLLSSVVVLWMLEPLLILGLAAAFTGLLPQITLLHSGISVIADVLTWLLNLWALKISSLPGAQLWFDTPYAALVCLLLIGLCLLAWHWRLPLRGAVPCILLAGVFAVGIGNALSCDVVHVELAGNSNTPAVVVTQGGNAIVLFRGGAAAQRSVETILARRGVQQVQLLVDLRTDPATECTLQAQQSIKASRMQPYDVKKKICTPAQVEVLRTAHGCLVRLYVGQYALVTMSGNVKLAQTLEANWLIASTAEPGAVRYDGVLGLKRYDWMSDSAQPPSALALRPGGGQRVFY